MAVRAPKRERKQREERKQRQRALIDEDAEVFVVRARDGEVGGLAAALPVERRDVAQVQRPAAAAEQRALRDERQEGAPDQEPRRAEGQIDVAVQQPVQLGERAAVAGEEPDKGKRRRGEQERQRPHRPPPSREQQRQPEHRRDRETAQRGGDAEQAVDKWVLDHYTGISPLIAREFAFRAGHETDVRFGALNDTQRGALVQEFSDTANAVKEDNYMPVILYRDGKPVDFTYRPIAQYGAETQVETRESFSQMLDEFYDARERQELSARRGRELTHAVTVARDRMARKAENLKHDYAATQKRDEFRLRGDLITANLYRMKSGEKVLHAENYYEDGCPTIDIPLDPLLSPQQNAAKNYKQYNKLKTAEFHLREQIEKAENERAYLESVLQELSQAETEQEFNEIRRELQETNYIRKSSGKKELKRAFAPRTFKTSSGLEVLVGRSNVQNDQLTKKADKRDYWFHTQHIHGSHVILRCAGLTPSDDDLREAAMLASYFSQAKESSSVPVDYCPVKFVKKPAGARPGMVTYDNYRTLYVTPEEGLAKKLFIR